MISPLLFLTPLFMAFEVWQLVISERYLGIKQIERGTDPRELGIGEGTAAFWSLTLLAYWAWIILLLFQTYGQVQAVCLGCVSLAGFSVRRNCGLKWVLVTLTFEGAVRLGMLLSLCALIWRKL
jgi:hypothetical protein